MKKRRAFVELNFVECRMWKWMKKSCPLIHFLLGRFEFKTQLSNCFELQIANMGRNVEFWWHNRWGRIQILPHLCSRESAWLLGHIVCSNTAKCAGRLAAVCFTRTSRRYCYFCDEALRFPFSLLSPRPRDVPFLADLHGQGSQRRSRDYSELVFGRRLRQFGEFFLLSGRSRWERKKIWRKQYVSNIQYVSNPFILWQNKITKHLLIGIKDQKHNGIQVFNIYWNWHEKNRSLYFFSGVVLQNHIWLFDEK